MEAKPAVPTAGPLIGIQEEAQQDNPIVRWMDAALDIGVGLAVAAELISI